MNRRALLLSASAAAAAAAFGVVTLKQKLRPRLHAILSECFGAEVADHPEAAAFLDQFAARGDTWDMAVPEEYLGLEPATFHARFGHEQSLRTAVVTAFGLSSTVVRHLERGDDLVYFGLFDPHGESNCLNPLAEFSA
ncbi:hypothetical protein [Frigidibacter sp. ROC022]|uniref:hypothetical protein n=1 Tax=Frigidibacter sp. ROC022 TaxID=2971796 RepID=UPI00215A6FAE|nr:hypothetical protein [Frigidibacter sp. ROC022]MCR8724279.1 hypothetical protein [Frigidibacter sp. ROC022]